MKKGKITINELHESVLQAKNIKLEDPSNVFNETTVEGAMKELFQNVDNGKSSIAKAIVDKGVQASKDDTFNTLSSKIASIKKGSGNAQPSDVLSGKTFANDNGATTGTMPNRGGATSVTPSATNQVKASGYYSGDITVLGDADLVAGNIKEGVNIFGVTGTVKQASGNAVAGDVIAGKTFSNSSGTATGTIPNRGGAVTVNPSTTNQVKPSGYYSGNITISGDPDLIAGNIKEGVNIFGVTGTVKKYDIPTWYTPRDLTILASSLPKTLFGLTCESINNNIYVIGGSYAKSLFCYNSITNKFETKVDMPIVLSYTASAVIGNKIYCFGGKKSNSTTTGPSNDFICYDTTSNTWEVKNSPNIYGRWGHSGKAVNGKIYYLGGMGSGSYASNYNDCYDPSTDTWSKKTNMPKEITEFGCSEIDGKIYCIGGAPGVSGTESTNYSYDTITNTWTTKASITTKRRSLRSVAYDKLIYCIGGRDYSTSNRLNECYNTVTDTWSTKASIISSDYDFGMALIDNFIFCMGGSSGSDRNECYII